MKTYVILVSENKDVKYEFHNSYEDAKSNAKKLLRKAIKKAGRWYTLSLDKKENNIHIWEVKGDVNTHIIISDVKHLDSIVNGDYIK